MRFLLPSPAFVACKGKEEKPEAAPTPPPADASRPAVIAAKRLLLLLLVACKEPAPAAKREPKVIPADPCEARAKRLGDRLETLYKEQPGGLPVVMPDVTLPVGRDPAIVDSFGVVVVLTRDDRVIAPGGVMDLRDGHDFSLSELEKLAALSSAGGVQLPVYFWADKDAKVSSLARLIGDTIERGAMARLLVAGDDAKPLGDLLERPSVKKYIAELPRGEADAHRYRSDRMEEAAAPCALLDRAYNHSSTGGPSMVEPLAVTRRVPQAIAECKCKLTDIAVFEYALLTMYGVLYPTPKWVAIPPLIYEPQTTVGDFVKNPPAGEPSPAPPEESPEL